MKSIINHNARQTVLRGKNGEITHVREGKYLVPKIKGRFFRLILPNGDVLRRKITFVGGRTFEWRFGWGNVSQLKEVDGKLTYKYTQKP